MRALRQPRADTFIMMMRQPRLLRTHWFNLMAALFIAALMLLGVAEIADALGLV